MVHGFSDTQIGEVLKTNWQLERIQHGFFRLAIGLSIQFSELRTLTSWHEGDATNAVRPSSEFRQES